MSANHSENINLVLDKIEKNVTMFTKKNASHTAPKSKDNIQLVVSNQEHDLEYV